MTRKHVSVASAINGARSEPEGRRRHASQGNPRLLTPGLERIFSILCKRSDF